MAKHALPEFEVLPIHESCKGCLKADDLTCSVYANPPAQWRLGFCPMATHLIPPSIEAKRKRRPGQQKQLKRKAGGKGQGRR